MAKRLKLEGLKFGRLTAIKDVGCNHLKQRLWSFKCDCGNEVIKPSVIVKSGTKSCGCLASEMTSARKAKKLDGMRFGRLVVSSKAGISKHGFIIWNCECDCGGSTLLASSSLVCRKTKSCGCLQREAAASILRARALPPHVKMQNRRMSAEKQRAKRKENPLNVMHSRLSRLHRHALSQVNALKDSPTFEALGYSVEMFASHIEKQFCKGMGFHNMSDWQIDHIIPISTAKSKDDVIALNQLSNLRPLWKKDNNRKKAKRLHLL